jgi:D-alanyl-D-alanine-carboxypeptidase/D-alanyl-D-alanine-endopeptidase
MQLLHHLLSTLMFRTRHIELPVLLAMLAIAPLSLAAQQKPTAAGEYAGTLGALHLKLHLNADAAGVLSGTLDSTDQGALGIPCADFHLDGQSLAFTVPAVHGTWKGTVTANGLTGTWDQGAPQPLNFVRDTFVPAAKPSPVDGIWLGALQAGGQSLRIQIHVKSDATGKEFCTLDSVDQGAMSLECGKVTFAAPNFSFEVPVVHGSWAGTLAVDGNSLSGTWNQGSPMALNFTRQAAALAAAPAPPPPPPTYDPAMPPVAAADLQSVLDKDLAEALKSGQLAPSTGAGVSIGIVEHGVRRVFSYGAAKTDSIFEIGSISKTFTALILSQLVEQGKVRFDEPVRELLPAGTVAKPAGDEITLLDLATQHSGLPPMPDNLKPADLSDPYADYRPANLYEFLAKHSVAKPATPGFVYSNLGLGLLGQALAVRSALPYPALLQEQVIDPLGLKDTTVVLTPEQQARFLPGHSGDHRPAHAWDFDGLAGAGAIRSTVGDMLTYLEANLHPGALKPSGKTPAASTLSAALTQQHQLRADAMHGNRIALAWLYEAESGNYWHNGATGGYSAFAFFNPQSDCAAIVLFNTSIGKNGSFADRLGQHISQRLAGKPAISLAN